MTESWKCTSTTIVLQGYKPETDQIQVPLTERLIYLNNTEMSLQLTWMVYLQTPRVFHSLMVLSREPDTIWRLSAEKATLKTSLVCPTNWRVVRPLEETSQTFQINITTIAK